MTNDIEADIRAFKQYLTAMAKKSGIHENFGQRQVDLLMTKYGFTKQTRAFDDWCTNFELTQLN
jgi:hypothetical protein